MALRKVSGSRSYILKGDAVLLDLALMQFALSRIVRKGFTPLLVPAMAKEYCFIGNSQFPRGREQTYALEADDLYLVGTAEVSITGMHTGEILREEFLTPLGMSANSLAKALKVTPARINDIVRERRGITADTALRLARYFGTDARSWMNLQSADDLRVAEVRRIGGEIVDLPCGPPSGGTAGYLDPRAVIHPGRVLDADGVVVRRPEVDSVNLLALQVLFSMGPHKAHPF